MRIVIDIIDHALQRYPTTGDWQIFANGIKNDGTITKETTLQVLVSNLGDWRMNALVGVHELCEALCCLNDGVVGKDVDAFDMAYERSRDFYFKRGVSAGISAAGPIILSSEGITETSEPGNDIRAPYYKQHQFATGVERILAMLLGVSWQAYEEANERLYNTAANGQ